MEWFNEKYFQSSSEFKYTMGQKYQDEEVTFNPLLSLSWNWSITFRANP